MAERKRSLSDLPEEAIEKILCRLPVKDAGRTSVLSRCWRHRWLSIRDLDLSKLSRSQIYQILSLHPGPVELLKVNEPDREDDGIGASEIWERHDVERWLTTLSLHSASSLKILILSSINCAWDLNLISRCLPSLGGLHFSGYCSAVPLQFEGFTSLRVLYLQKFIPEDDWEGISRLISACPLLEVVHLINEHDDELFDYSLEIVAPNLRVLDMQGLRLSHFTVKSAPLLKFVRMFTFYPNEEEEVEDSDDDGGGGGIGYWGLVNVFRGMTTINELEVDHNMLEYLGIGHVPDRIPICFNHLTTITVMDANFGYEKPMLVLLCLLRSCPSLQEVEMGRRYHTREPEEADHDVWNPEAQEGEHLFKSLESVTMTRIMCTRHELGFIKFILAKAEVLKTVEISFHQQVKDRDSIVADLLEYPRVSSQARILLSSHSLLPANIYHETELEMHEKYESIKRKMQAQFDALYQHLGITPPASQLDDPSISAQPINNPGVPDGDQPSKQ